MEILKILIPIISVFLGAFIGQPIIHFVNLFQRRKLKRIENAVESLKLFENFETEFKSDFILPDLKESYFYIQTGIETNEKSIEKYINLKNKLSGNYTWKQIKSAKSYLDLNGKNIVVKLNKIEKIGANLILIIALILIASTFIIFLIYSSDLEYFSQKDYLKFIILIMMPFLGGFLLANSVFPIQIAKGIEKKLKDCP
jgi:uncharacterized integral membrane protein